MAVISNTSSANYTSQGGGHDAGSSYYLSIGLIVVPGILLNVLALVFILRDIRKAMFPAIVLLLSLCCADLAAVTASFIQHTVSRYVHSVSYSMCAAIAIFHIFFKVYAGALNTLMAIDRYLAICAPFFYKSRVQIKTWKIGCISAALGTALFCMCPFVGLGDVWKTVTMHGQSVKMCSSFAYSPDIVKRVYGIMYGVIGFIVVLTICVCNSLVIRAVVRLNKRIVSLQTEPSQNGDSSVRASQVNSFEIAFAKLMGCLAVVYLVCGTPYNVLTFLQQVNATIPSAVKGVIHLLAGLSYSIDPIVYILIRKATRRRLANICLRCEFRKDDTDH